ncbi:hypothetical protein GCM10009038_21730 [Salinicola rhizosphaerae]|uniref:Uncharacterized protein n=1 Tax=Salinicola rhizosphaerae TaxID=1443141 RepID=A0ABQ3E176_9GAMM|nr:hypothetical protein GCM10009038_21730 [Salinicola rhizosphaerae]
MLFASKLAPTEPRFDGLAPTELRFGGLTAEEARFEGPVSAGSEPALVGESSAHEMGGGFGRRELCSLTGW